MSCVLYARVLVCARAVDAKSCAVGMPNAKLGNQLRAFKKTNVVIRFITK